MPTNQTKRSAIIGAGISGLAAAHILQQRGHSVIIYEKSDKVGGVWANSYPDVRLQNTYQQYHISDFPWQFQPDLNPTGTQILRYMNEAIVALKLDVRLAHSVTSMQEVENGWQVTVDHGGQMQTQFFDYVILAVGQYTGRKQHLAIPGQDKFQGEVLTEIDVKNLNVFANKRVVVVGFGKSALDMVTFAAQQGAAAHHVFRTPRWTIPSKILGIHYTHALFSRFGSVMMSSWAQPNNTERFLHERLRFIVMGFWKMLGNILRFQAKMTASGKGVEAQKRIETVLPKHAFLPDLRSAGALAPDEYYPFVASGKIQPHHAEVTALSETGVILSDGTEIACDVVVTAVGSTTPTFPFLPDNYRLLLECEPDGVQLYRHLIHPRIPNLGFAGYNHGFMHIPAAEVGTLWLSAVVNGEMQLPSIEEMEQTIEYVRQWKRDNIHFEPSRSCAVSTRYQQYLDILLQDLGLSPNRKLPNPVAEIFARYSASDFAGLVQEYEKTLQTTTPQRQLRPIAAHT